MGHQRAVTVICQSVLILLATLSVASRSFAVDTYGPGNGELHIPSLNVGNATLSGVVLTVDLPPVSGPSGSVPVGTGDRYDPATNVLTIPAVKVGATTYYNAAASVRQLTSFAGMQGGDTFDGTSLVLRDVQVIGGQAYHDVTLRAAAGNVLGIGSGLPGVAVDAYDPSTGRLTIGAVQFGTKVYTNVRLHVGLADIVAVGGYTTSVLHTFAGSDGGSSYAGLTVDAAGNLFGTTNFGGAVGFGTVFRVTPSGTETVLYSFTGMADGATPMAGLLLDGAGNLYGTTTSGGDHQLGTVFRVTPSGTETVLYSFAGGTDGAHPYSTPIMDGAGNLYGTTLGGGTNNMGTVFEVTPAGAETVLHRFVGGTDGNYPEAGLVMDGAGNLFGTTSGGGSGLLGTVFKVTPSGAESVVHAFTAGTDGGSPMAGLIVDSAGNLYGTTDVGGTSGDYGTVFKLTPSGTESILYRFTGGSDGGNPAAGLVMDGGGNLYGTTFDGASGGNGTAFRLTTAGSLTVLHAFTGGADGAGPKAGLAIDSAGILYGTTPVGGTKGFGTVFMIR